MGSRPPVGAQVAVSGEIPQRAGAVAQKASISWVVLTSFQPVKVDSRPDADVDRAVANREHPPIPGKWLPSRSRMSRWLSIQGSSWNGLREIAADRHAERVRAVPRGAEGPAEAGVGAVGDDDVAAPGPSGRSRSSLSRTMRARDAGRPRRAARSPRSRARAWRRPSPPARRPSRRARGGARRSRRAGSRGGRARRSSRVMPCADRAQPVEALEFARAARRGPCRAAAAPRAGSGRRRRSCRAGTASCRRPAPVAERREPVRGRRPGRPRADDQHVGTRRSASFARRSPRHDHTSSSTGRTDAIARSYTWCTSASAPVVPRCAQVRSSVVARASRPQSRQGAPGPCPTST